MRKILLAIALSLAAHGILGAGTSILRPDHPDRYIVVKGDTLWDISSTFLSQAWLWPEIWYKNPDIENPHLIYPGDVIYLVFVDGKPQLVLDRPGTEEKSEPEIADGKLLPRIRVSDLSSAIPAIPLDEIASLLTTGRIVDRRTLDEAPYILAGKADRLIFGPGDVFYARSDEWPADNPTVFGIYRRGVVYIDPETGEVLGLEAREVGTANVIRRDVDIYSLRLAAVKEDVRIGDRLLATEEQRVESTFYPTAPTRQVNGVIMTVLGSVTMVGRHDVVAINRGFTDGLDVGDVLAIHKRGIVVKDRVAGDKIQLPSERAGILMIFRSFQRMAYGLILETEEPIRVGDTVQNP
jgi:hypothetical protein